jgi:hypothetical protein
MSKSNLVLPHPDTPTPTIIFSFGDISVSGPTHLDVAHLSHFIQRVFGSLLVARALR